MTPPNIHKLLLGLPAGLVVASEAEQGGQPPPEAAEITNWSRRCKDDRGSLALVSSVDPREEQTVVFWMKR